MDQCVNSYPNVPRDRSLTMPGDMRSRLNVRMSMRFKDLIKPEQDEILLHTDELLDILESWRFGRDGLHITHATSTDDKNVSITHTSSSKPTVMWQSMECYTIGCYEEQEERIGYDKCMSDAEILAFSDVLKEIERSLHPILELESTSTRKIRGRGTVKTVRCDKALASSVRYLPNSSIIIDGVNWVVQNVECFMPIKEGDVVGLVVRKPEGNERLVNCAEHGWSRCVRIDDGPACMCASCSKSYGGRKCEIIVRED